MPQRFLVFDRGSYIGTFSSGEIGIWAVSREYIQRIIVPQIKAHVHAQDDGFWLHIQDIDLDFNTYPFKDVTFEAFVAKTPEEQVQMAQEWLSAQEHSFAGTEWQNE